MPTAELGNKKLVREIERTVTRGVSHTKLARKRPFI